MFHEGRKLDGEGTLWKSNKFQAAVVPGWDTKPTPDVVEEEADHKHVEEEDEPDCLLDGDVEENGEPDQLRLKIMRLLTQSRRCSLVYRWEVEY